MTEDRTTLFTTGSDDTSIGRAPACVVVIAGGELGKRYAIAEAKLTFGREPDNAVVLDMSSVSRHHATIGESKGLCFIEDLGSTNGSFVNGKEVEGRFHLSNGDLIKLGRAVFKFIEGGNIESLYHEEIYRLTIEDGLTQVPNKRFFLEFLDRERVRAERHKRPLSLAMMDVDHFKGVNDTYGHLAGDHILREVARLAKELVRKDELIARYGGEEFVVVLPETGMDGAVEFCERLRKAIESHSFMFDGQDIRITMSFGVAENKIDQDNDALIGTADEFLYQAKETGRNRVVSAGHS